MSKEKNNTKLESLNKLIEFGDEALKNKINFSEGCHNSDNDYRVDNESFNKFRSSALSFLEKIFEKEHLYYIEFNEKVKDRGAECIEAGLGILKAVKNELETLA
ncbi:MAG: hypothetical protein OMM_11491 [Candidatus Magnetoglobus multicellularis str. Araruama]|uniref:Uncharacterized protein n=1 Tax=Candidatus Magnetoglobus multicellularis str. Araruama TaxID=890399 RepID=A0A1V1NY63_9BACT|nr:MAG: hypothetical protein OMM_11491 [Candidatus Magnetoglobus multicellularis str. Araruama]